MRWKGRQESSNVDDRRGSGGGGFRAPRRGMKSGGGLGIGGIVVVLLISWVTGINPLELLGTMEGGSQSVETRQTSGPRPAGEDELASFVSVVLADTENTWTQLMQAEGHDYPEPRLVLFTDYVPSACGQASSATGPFYCGADQQIYIDLSFYRQLSRELGAPGDFAQAYVLAHEVGHHVQNVLGILPEYQRVRRSLNEADANALSVRVELQADCLAGVWAHHAARQQGFVEDGDVEEALNAASRIGDDTLQREAQGYVVPESFNHGTSAQRARWFREGFASGDMGSCDTFNARRL
ncbi:KPN_02809 family neutral zinc metallopeptidase [Pannonibacter carbonis]|uniref:KPN_02809 family neutral zinc metallopeptidase n=1 Tax=Pannonibacter carbonis TaxID=2067569 RepID=UPI000D0FDD9C|nr:neutral zinc metallopeptidase [Pannonibacter carbonis]